MKLIIASLAFLAVASGAVVYSVPSTPFLQNGFALQSLPYALNALNAPLNAPLNAALSAPFAAPLTAPLTASLISQFQVIKRSISIP